MRKSEILSRQAADKAYQAMIAGELDSARQLANRAARLDARNDKAWRILAAVSTPQDSLRYIRKACRIDPENPQNKAGLEWAQARLKDTALSVQRQAEELEKSPQTKRNRNGLLQRMSARWQSLAAIALVVLIALTALLAPVLAPVQAEEGSPYFKVVCDELRCQPQPPSAQSPLGTVAEYDVLHTLIWGFRQALTFGLTTAGLTALLGICLGAVAAFSGGWLDQLIMRVCDGFLAFPIIAAVAMFSQVIAYLTPESLGLSLVAYQAIPENPSFLQSLVLNSDPVLIALILFSWMPYARIVHAQVLQVKKTEYVDAARTLGIRRGRILFRHVLPNAISPAIVMLTRDIGRMVVLQASLTYIGISNSSAWANLLTSGKDWIIGPGGDLLKRWWIYLPITLAIVLFGISWNWLGDEVNIWINPHRTQNKKLFG
ncbi:MAG: peptide/nickel transport system permease protein [Chloroflexota bacterium]|nr:peptide/nickel transport system permease protein [Chloroflexota bacterium]